MMPEAAVYADILIRAPTSGGQYHWAAMLAPPFCKNFVSYIMGRCHVLLSIIQAFELVGRLLT